MIDFSNSQLLINTLSVECNNLLAEERTSFGATLEMHSNDAIHNEKWPEGKELLTIRDSTSKKPLLFIIKFKSTELLWFNYSLPKVNDSKLLLIQDNLKNILENLQFQETQFNVTKIEKISRKSNVFNNAKKNIGTDIYLVLIIFLILYSIVFLSQLSIKTDSNDILYIVSVFFGYSFAMLCLVIFIEPVSFYKLPKTQVKNGVEKLITAIDSIAYKVNQKLVDTDVKTFCSLIIYNQIGSLTDKSDYCYYNEDYYLFDLESGLKVSKLNFIKTDEGTRIVLIPLLKSNKKFEHIGLLYLEFLEFEKFEFEHFTFQLSKNNLAKSSSNFVTNLVIRNKISSLVSFQLCALFAIGLSILVGYNQGFSYLPLPFFSSTIFYFIGMIILVKN